MRKLMFSLSLLVTLTLLVGCGAEQYRLTCDDGGYYIILPENVDNRVDLNAEQQLLPMVKFDSISEMREDITLGTFTQEEIMEVAQFPADDSGRIPICDIETLYEPVYPSFYNDYQVAWYGYRYTFVFMADDEQPEGCWIVLYYQTEFSEIVEKFQDYETSISMGCEQSEISITTENERNAKVFSYMFASGKNNYQERKECVYTVEGVNGIYYVNELYECDVSDEVPKQVTIYGEYDGQTFEVKLTNLESRPSVALLTSFGLTEYKAEADSVS